MNRSADRRRLVARRLRRRRREEESFSLEPSEKDEMVPPSITKPPVVTFSKSFNVPPRHIILRQFQSMTDLEEKSSDITVSEDGPESRVPSKSNHSECAERNGDKKLSPHRSLSMRNLGDDRREGKLQLMDLMSLSDDERSLDDSAPRSHRRSGNLARFRLHQWNSSQRFPVET